MGELIAFKPASGGVRLRTAPISHCTVVIFTGIWQDRAKGDNKPKRARRRSGKRPKQATVNDAPVSLEQSGPQR